MQRILSAPVAMGTGLFEPLSININHGGDVETWLKIKYYTPVFKGKVAETEIQENNPCAMALKRRGADTASVSAGKRNQGRAEKKPTLLIPVERCREGELQPCTSKRELGCSERSEDPLRRGRHDTGTRHCARVGAGLIPQPPSPRRRPLPGALRCFFAFFFWSFTAYFSYCSGNL